MKATLGFIRDKWLGYQVLRIGEQYQGLAWDFKDVPAWVVTFVDQWNRKVCDIVGHDDTLKEYPEEREPDGTYHCPMCCTKLGPAP